MEMIKELLPDAYVLRPQIFEDERGILEIPYHSAAMETISDHTFQVTQTIRSVSKKGVLRGLHYQTYNSPIDKLVSCLWGKVYDVIVDLRPRSMAYGSWAAIELSRENRFHLYVPQGFAHGYLSLTNQSEVFYYQCGDYDPEAARILSWCDPDLNIEWPISDTPILSERDRTQGGRWADYKANPEF